jgi:putative flippase GtrA
VTFNRLIALFLLLMASAWVALVNGQPLFISDTTAYVRGPDFAAVYFLGKNFATSWTQERTLQGIEAQNNKEQAPVTKSAAKLNSPFESAIMAGRSVYYGALLYLAHVTSYLWLAVFAQALVFLYLAYTLVLKCLRLSFFTFVCAAAVTLAITPLSFFISLLVPDVFASYLILGLGILIGFWDKLKLPDRSILLGIIFYSALTHTSHLILLAALGLLFAIISFLTKRAHPTRSPYAPPLAIFALIFTALLGQLAFGFAARHTIHADPIQPPFITARIIADGPGYQFLKENCAQKKFVVCNYMDRLPTPSNTFLWSTDQKEGVFSIADLPTRVALSSEQIPFLFDVFRSEPIPMLTSLAKNFVRQLELIGTNEFFVGPDQLQSLKDNLPDYYFSGLTRARIVLHDSILTPLNVWYSLIYFLSAITLIVVWAFWPRIQSTKLLGDQKQWFYLLSIVLIGSMLNAAICGTLSEPVTRYQTRISWLPFILLSLLAASFLKALSPEKDELEFVHHWAQRLPRALRFIGIGGIGLATDLGAFTIIATFTPHALIARLGSLAIATLVTWRLNRALTFSPSGRRQHEEAVRYAIVTIIAQGTSYAIFAALVLTVLQALPQIAILVGAAIGAVLSYNGHRLLSFAPQTIYSRS